MISITLPSIYPDCLPRALANIEATTVGKHEVIVVSPFAPPNDANNVIWIEETVSKGANAAHAQAARIAEGDYIVAWVDDHDFVPGWDEMMIEEYRNREVMVRQYPFLFGFRHTVQAQVGTIFGHYYPYFPMIRRDYLLDIGGWLKSEYVIGFADGDLAMRVWNAGGRCEWASKPVVLTDLADDRKAHINMLDKEAHCLPEDMELFLKRWGKVYGSGWSTASLRDFNWDLCPEHRPAMVDALGNSIRIPDRDTFYRLAGR